METQLNNAEFRIMSSFTTDLFLHVKILAAYQGLQGQGRLDSILCVHWIFFTLADITFIKTPSES